MHCCCKIVRSCSEPVFSTFEWSNTMKAAAWATLSSPSTILWIGHSSAFRTNHRGRGIGLASKRLDAY